MIGTFWVGIWRPMEVKNFWRPKPIWCTILETSNQKEFSSEVRFQKFSEKITSASIWGWKRPDSNKFFLGFFCPYMETCFHEKKNLEFARTCEFWTLLVEHLLRLFSPRWRLLVPKFHFYIKAKTHSFQEWCGNPTFYTKKGVFGAFENDVPKFDLNGPNFETSISRG